MISATLGNLKFTGWEGDPLLAQTVWEMEERAGVPGVLFADAGTSAEPFMASVWTDMPSDSEARDLLTTWQNAVSLPPQPLTIANKSYGNFKLLRVMQPRAEAVFWVRGGNCELLPGSPVGKGVAMAQLLLRQIVVAPV